MHHIPRGLSRARLPCPAPLRSGPQAAPAPDTLLLLGPQHLQAQPAGGSRTTAPSGAQFSQLENEGCLNLLFPNCLA